MVAGPGQVVAAGTLDTPESDHNLVWAALRLPKKWPLRTPDARRRSARIERAEEDLEDTVGSDWLTRLYKRLQ